MLPSPDLEHISVCLVAEGLGSMWSQKVSPTFPVMSLGLVVC